MTVPPERKIKDYELREMVGAGGFGAVYRAYQIVVAREVAIKVILPQRANQPEFIRYFEVEAQTVARLEHPHIVLNNQYQLRTNHRDQYRRLYHR
jgi:serine/threonine protein kinase